MRQPCAAYHPDVPALHRRRHRHESDGHRHSRHWQSAIPSQTRGRLLRCPWREPERFPAVRSHSGLRHGASVPNVGWNPIRQYQTRPLVRFGNPSTCGAFNVFSAACATSTTSPVGGHSDRHLSQPIGFAVVRTQLRHGIHADEAVSTPRSAKFSRFEDERTGTASCETLVEADWGSMNQPANGVRWGMTR